MGFTCQYPIDFRVKVLSEYKQGKVGYKTLANKYGLKRDTVRYWVLQEKSDSFMLIDAKNKETVDERSICRRIFLTGSSPQIKRCKNLQRIYHTLKLKTAGYILVL